MITEQDVMLKFVSSWAFGECHYLDYHDDSLNIHLTIATPRIDDYTFGPEERHYRYRRPNGRIYDCRTLKGLVAKYNQDYIFRGSVRVAVGSRKKTIKRTKA